ncbi:hypothetical protein JVU11DRAFT_1526 [Chiua virens]|nr:hypothetical protein JVU11DRAFT_1526 [Chiua virens]
MSQPVPSLPRFTPSTIRSLRDLQMGGTRAPTMTLPSPTSIRSCINIMALYAVRRPYYVRDAELERAYHDCGEDILRGIEARSRTAARLEMKRTSVDDSGALLSLWNLILQWLRALVRRFSKAG